MIMIKRWAVGLLLLALFFVACDAVLDAGGIDVGGVEIRRMTTRECQDLLNKNHAN